MLSCAQSGRGQTWPTRDEQTDETSAGLRSELEREDGGGGYVGISDGKRVFLSRND